MVRGMHHVRHGGKVWAMENDEVCVREKERKRKTNQSGQNNRTLNTLNTEQQHKWEGPSSTDHCDMGVVKKEDGFQVFFNSAGLCRAVVVDRQSLCPSSLSLRLLFRLLLTRPFHFYLGIDKATCRGRDRQRQRQRKKRGGDT